MISKMASLVLAIVLFYCSGCDQKSCQDVVCGVNQQCSRGQCFCVDGYEGTDCQTFSNQKYIGNYQVNENCFGSSSNFSFYNCSINSDPFYANRININNLFGLGANATALIFTDQSNQGNYIEIPNQSQGALLFSGSGTFDPLLNQLTLNLNYTFNGGSYQCTHTFYKQ
jgi:hypothetical protein